MIRNKSNVLYLGVGNPCSPASGMDIIVREHIFELLKIDQIALKGVVVAPFAAGLFSSFETLSLPGFDFLWADRQDMTMPFNRIISKIAFILSGKLLVSYSYRSRAASEHITKHLLERPDLIIVDHLMTMSNTNMGMLRKYASGLIFIAHDVTFQLIIDGGRFKKQPIKKLYYLVQAIQAWILDAYLIKSCTKTAFLSDWDRQCWRWISPTKTVSLCPILRSSSKLEAIEKPNNSSIKSVLFIGSPSFAPNKFAIEWLVSSLAPELFVLDPEIAITLAGKGTEKYSGKNGSNIVGLGFVPEQDLPKLLNDCVAILSPINHGSGLKIKVLEAFAAGCPVLATEKSLRGFEFMRIEPKIDITKPRKTAEEIVALTYDLKLQARMRAEIRQRWSEHVSRREGKLEKIVFDAIRPIQA